MMASFVPKPVSVNPTNKGIISGSVTEDSISTSGSYNQPGGGPTQQPLIYDTSPHALGTTDNKKINGNVVPPTGNQQVQQQIQEQLQKMPQNLLPGNSGPNKRNSGSNVVPTNIISSNTTVEPGSPDVLSGSRVRGHPSGSIVNTNSGILAIYSVYTY